MATLDESLAALTAAVQSVETEVAALKAASDSTSVQQTVDAATAALVALVPAPPVVEPAPVDETPPAA
jgi:hypothetical protein